ncbi:CKLF-like MARVEL transmembrane domain-containing protein 8 isoform X1 [Tribolium castaneum]|uniref:CKLF-like MARVEL transmembrane domain-containing protein 8 isoform X1 n=1 Tax=Tribolium castaneum TaxID=7070 RepID=UPI0030FE88AC
MADPGFPGQHTTTTTVTSNTTVQTNIRYDPTYIRTLPGILKVAEIVNFKPGFISESEFYFKVLNLLGFICIEVSAFSYVSRGSFFIFVSMTAFWFTGFLLLFYLFHVIEKFYRIPWLKIEFGFDALWAALYLIAACLAATYGIEAFAVAAFFGFCAMVVYAGDAYLKFKAAMSGELAQGERVINKQTTTSPTHY